MTNGKNDITEQEITFHEDKIKPERFQALILYAQGYTYEQMSAYLQIPLGTVKSRLARARADFKKLLSTIETEVKEVYDGASA
jgi:hypothetical protein